MSKRILATLILLTGLAFGQVNGGSFGGNPIIFPSGQYVSSALVRVCNVPVSGFPCSNPVSPLYTDGTLGTTQANPIILTPLNFGQYSFGAPAGNYQVQVSGTGLQSYSFPVSFGFPASGTTGSGGILVLQTSPTIITPTISSPVFTGGLCKNAGTACQHIRVASCTTAAAPLAACNTTVTWGTPFLDTNYSVSCGVELVGGHPFVTSYQSKLAGSISVTLSTYASDASNGNINCSAIHD